MSFAFPSAEALGVRFRPAGDDDLPFLAHLYASTRWEEVAQTGWSPEAQARFLAQQFDLQHRHYLQHYPKTEKLVIERDGAPVGRVYVEETPGMIHLIDIALLPEARGGGIGTAIMDDLLRQAGERGRRIVLYVEKNNPVRFLYGRLGFSTAQDEGVYNRMEWMPPDMA
jgi:ribosomal protein S18 acetylase RimI-like enzyme